jgi:hypothetical protein
MPRGLLRFVNSESRPLDGAGTPARKVDLKKPNGINADAQTRKQPYKKSTLTGEYLYLSVLFATRLLGQTYKRMCCGRSSLRTTQDC